MFRTSSLLSLIPALLIGACGGSTTDGGADDGGGDSTAECPALTGERLTHSGDLFADETWAGDGTVHHLTFDVLLRGVTLTLDPCAVVEIDGGYGIELRETAGVGARLVALGTEAEPIVVRRAEATEPFGTISSFYATGEIDLAWVTLEGGGAVSYRGYVIEMRGGEDERFADPVLGVDHVVIDGSEGGGIKLEGSAAFTADSTDLAVVDSGTVDTDYPLVVTPIAVSSVPTGEYAGNAAGEILVTATSLKVRRDVTVRDRGLPYYWHFDRIRVYDEDGGATPTLRIEAGVEMRLDDYVGVGAIGTLNHLGVLLALGTPAAPVVFTSAESSRAAGDWPGVWLEYATGSRLENVVIEYAGGDNYATSANCRPSGSADDAALLLGWGTDDYVPSADDLSGVTIRQSAAHGINAMWTTGGFGPDVTAGITFDGISGCRQTKNGTTTGCQSAPGCLVP